VRLLITPQCASFEEMEGQINSLEDELDEIRERARCAFQVT
jgi:cell division protein FtsB